jgi:uncharacterized phage protein gp47/JayE
MGFRVGIPAGNTVMTTELTSLGLQISRYADLVSEYNDASKAVWGKSIDTSQLSSLGHIHRLIALSLAEINETLQAVIDVTSAANASGNHLDHLFSLIDLRRQSAAKSTVTLTYTVSSATTIPAGHRVKTSAGVVFQTLTDLVFSGSGSDDVLAKCTEDGPFDAAIGEVSIPVTTLDGLTSVTNSAAAIPGRLRDTDPQFRARHTAAVATSGEDDVASIYEAVSSVDGVSSVYVDEDTNNHTITVSVIGGSDNYVAAAINNNRTAGISTVGTESVEVFSATTGQVATINFYRADDEDFYIDLTLTKNDALFPVDGEAQIKAALVALADEYVIGQTVDYYGLLAPIYSVQGVTVTDMRIGWAPSPTGTANLTTTIIQRPALPIGNISISFTS